MRARPSLVVLAALLLLLAAAPGLAGEGGAAAPDRDGAAAPEKKAEPATPAAPPRAALTAASCETCHPKVVAEWRGSMHAQSTRETNPLYRAAFARAEKALGPKARARCSGCHYPAWIGATPPEGLPVEGVTCVVCHVLHPEHPRERLEDGRHAHLVGDESGRFGAEQLCLSCHGVLRSPEGHPVCTTGPESEEALVGNCTDCHMAETGGAPTVGTGEPDGDRPSHASHAFPGSRSARILRTSASVALTITPKGDGADEKRQIVATVTPGEVGHYVPTGTPLRSLALQVTAYDEGDDVLWRNLADADRGGGGALAKAPEAVFQFVFSDAEGNRPVPAFLAKGKGDDRRLKPDEPRTIRYPLPKGTARVEAVLTYHLAPPKILVAAGAPAAWRAPVVVAEAKATP